MKYYLALIFLFGIIQMGRTLNVIDFVEGLVIGLHIDNLSPKTRECEEGIEINIKAFQDVIKEFKKDSSGFEKIDILTKALGYIPDTLRSCVSIPEDFWKNFKKKFLEEFNYDIVDYLHAVFINLGEKKDKILDNLRKIGSNFRSGKSYESGYYTGDLINVILNVTNPIPKRLAVGSTYQMSRLSTIDWDVVHEYFVEYFGYAVVVLNYTKWIDIEHMAELNYGVLNGEMTIYKGIKDFNGNNILQGILKIIEVLKFVNKIFRGSYFAIAQGYKGVIKNSIIEYRQYFWANLVQHIGYFVWDGYMLSKAIKEKNWKETLRRAVVISRKFFYLDEDGLDDM